MGYVAINILLKDYLLAPTQRLWYILYTYSVPLVCSCSLRGDYMGNEGVAHIAEALKSNHRLKHLE